MLRLRSSLNKSVLSTPFWFSEIVKSSLCTIASHICSKILSSVVLLRIFSICCDTETLLDFLKFRFLQYVNIHSGWCLPQVLGTDLSSLSWHKSLMIHHRFLVYVLKTPDDVSFTFALDVWDNFIIFILCLIVIYLVYLVKFPTSFCRSCNQPNFSNAYIG